MAAKQIIHVAGWRGCPYFDKAATVVSSLHHLLPGKVVAQIHEYESRDAYRGWVTGDEGAKKFPSAPASFTSSPFCWRNEDQFIGGCDDALAFVKSAYMDGGASAGVPRAATVDADAAGDFDYDLVVIGGGSGGLACAKEAASNGLKVACLDYVKPSPLGSTWGLGGTCVNVGCIPKKLCHQGSLIGETMHSDAAAFGWRIPSVSHDWPTMISRIQDYIYSLNFGYRKDLRDKSVKYINALGSFKDAHTMNLENPRKEMAPITAKRFVVAVGGRPTPIDCEGGDLAVSSDDLFSMETPPGKTLVVGASYVALECAGFLTGIGCDTTVMVRSILLRGFDQQCANMIGDYMDKTGTKFIRGATPQKLEKTADGKIAVTWSGANAGTDVYDTVFAAIGRYADTSKLGLDTLGVALNRKGEIVHTDEQTSVPHIYGLGDVLEDVPELTPAAIQAGKLLAKRISKTSTEPMDYGKVCTTVFTPIEYGCVGLSEEDAIEKYGDSLEVYHQNFTPLEWALPEERPKNFCYLKVLVDKTDDERVIGMHIVGPNAGEIMQGFGVAVKMGLKRSDLSDCVGIHPTVAELFTTLTVSKSSGEAADAGGC